MCIKFSICVFRYMYLKAYFYIMGGATAIDDIHTVNTMDGATAIDDIHSVDMLLELAI